MLPNKIQYLEFLRNDLPGLLETNVVFTRRCTPHFRLHVRDFLNQVHGVRCIGRGGPIAWPPRSPDLNPLDFLWDHLKNGVYRTEVKTVDDL